MTLCWPPSRPARERMGGNRTSEDLIEGGGLMTAIARGITGLTVSTMLTLSACAPVADPTPGGGPLLALADLAAQRVQIADAVAAAKWGTDTPIDDPAREQAVLDNAATKSRQL